MALFFLDPNFSTLFNAHNKKHLIEQIMALTGMENDHGTKALDLLLSSVSSVPQEDEQMATTWLMTVFNTLFAHQHVTLIRGEHEPEYFPATDHKPARIQFAHGFFSSAMHELSHWCIAGSKRRGLIDFGYWYAPDGRSAAQQQQFEQLEVRPQALEYLFTLACNRPFQVSQDNLFADFDTSSSTFATDVYHQAAHYIDSPQQLPRDAKLWLLALLMLNDAESTAKTS